MSAVEAGRISVLNGASPGGLSTGVEYKVFSKIVEVESTDAPEIIDFTDTVRQLVTESGVTNGQVTVYSTHTTFSVMINENEPLLMQDLEQLLGRIAPPTGHYQHNDFTIRTVNMTEEECPNGHAHCQHLLLNASETVPIIEGVLQLGRWQSVFLL